MTIHDTNQLPVLETCRSRRENIHSEPEVNTLQQDPRHWIMSAVGSTNHNKRLASETDNSQRVLNNESAQHLKLRERQRFFEEVYQHDVVNYVPSTHLQIDCRKPPMGSISSMEVNVDVLEQMDLMDIADQEALDVFLNSGSGAEEGALASPLPDDDDDDDDDDEEEDEYDEDEDAEVVYRERAPLQRQAEVYRGSQSRISSTSSGSSNASISGADTPVIQSDDEEVHADTQLLTSVPQEKDEETGEEEEEEEEERCCPTHFQKD
ncbi:dysbindin-like [Cololabis saira]|uniref:dysbindin-like n=1 Tax=Cololabis saira TaxID=129043 RepID=UPI002AD35485|nr:dysbindin-like [Cololabis saira]